MRMHTHSPHTPLALAVREGIFCAGRSLDGFCRLFYLDNPQIVANKKGRWFRFLKAEREGKLFERPNVAPLWQPHKVYQPQMPGVLQSGYEDVEKELVVMTKYARENNVGVLFVAGDGLALMRLNHLLKNKPHLYMDQTPVVVPIQGALRKPYTHEHAPELIPGRVELVPGRANVLRTPHR